MEPEDAFPLAVGAMIAVGTVFIGLAHFICAGPVISILIIVVIVLVTMIENSEE